MGLHLQIQNPFLVINNHPMGFVKGQNATLDIKISDSIFLEKFCLVYPWHNLTYGLSYPAAFDLGGAEMDIPRKIGIGVVMIIPTFVGAGIWWELFSSWAVVLIWIFFMGGLYASILRRSG
ncbi:MAG: hypothetical protein K9M96_04440 [Deltaproteobacteria bacterium]|nr:hypothetical protein [Deltaproteobacteria bacterium]